MINKIDINISQPMYESEASKRQEINKTSAQINTDASINVQNASLLDSALNGAQTDPNLVAQAKEALLSGRLDTYENILQAAENIIKFGV
jgi:hypothetical protein